MNGIEISQTCCMKCGNAAKQERRGAVMVCAVGKTICRDKEKTKCKYCPDCTSFVKAGGRVE